MATFAELLTASTNDVLRQKVRVACIIAAEAVRTEVGVTNHAARLAWAKGVFVAPESEGNRMLLAVLAQNQAAAYSTIIGASDAVVLACVMLAIDMFAS